MTFVERRRARVRTGIPHLRGDRRVSAHGRGKVRIIGRIPTPGEGRHEPKHLRSRQAFSLVGLAHKVVVVLRHAVDLLAMEGLRHEATRRRAAVSACQRVVEVHKVALDPAAVEPEEGHPEEVVEHLVGTVPAGAGVRL